MGDTNEKLLADYNKVKSQLLVLKDALLEEQNRSAKLQEKLRLSEVQGRKNEQEIESLSFRNTQLTKRVSVLLEELNSKQLPKSNKAKEPAVKTTNNVELFDEELQKRIFENAELKNDLADKKLELANTCETVEKLEKQVAELENAMKDKDREIESLLEKLSNAPVPEDRTIQYENIPDSEIVEYFLGKLEKVVDEKEYEESKAKAYELECESLSKHLERALANKEHLEETYKKLQEDSSLTVKNYELQLKTMSEHLADLSDKIAAQSEVICRLQNKSK